MTERELKRGVRKESVSSRMQQFLENKKEALRLGVHKEVSTGRIGLSCHDFEVTVKQEGLWEKAGRWR